MRKSDARADARANVRAGLSARHTRRRFTGGILAAVASAVCVVLFGWVAVVVPGFMFHSGSSMAFAQAVAQAQADAQAQAQAPAQTQAQAQASSVQAQAQAQAPVHALAQAQASAQASSKTGAAGANGADGDSLEMTAEEVRYQGKDRVTVAEGKVVVAYKSFRITGDYAEYDDRVPCVRVRGKDKAKFEDTKEKTVLSAAELVFYPNEEKVDASGGVTVSYQDGRVGASGDRVSYLGKEKKGIVTGNARVEMGRKVFTAASITVLFADETVVATGGTRTVIPGEEITSPN